MTMRRIVLLAVILITAVAGSFYLNPQAGQEARSFAATVVAPVRPAATPTSTPAYVAARALPAFQVLDSNSYKCNQKAPNGCADLASPADKLLLTSLAANAPIKSAEVIPAASIGDIVTISVSGARGLAGQLQPGDTVDLYVGPRLVTNAEGKAAVLPPASDLPPGALATAARVLKVAAADTGYQVTLGLAKAQRDAAANIARLADIGEFYLTLRPRQ